MSEMIAPAIVQGITSQTELITSLSLAVIGGLLAFFLQIRMHNATPSNSTIELCKFYLLIIAFVASGIAIGLGYLVSGTLIEIAPQVFSHSFDVEKSFSDQNFGIAPVGMLRALSITQFLVFLGGIVYGILFIVCNRR